MASGVTVRRSTSPSRFRAMFHCGSFSFTSASVRPGIAGSAQGLQAIAGHRPVEEAGEPQEGELALALRPGRLQPALVGDHHLERRAALTLQVGLLELHLLVMTDVLVVGIGEESAEQLQRQRVPAGILPGRLHLGFRADDLQVAQEGDRRLLHQLVELLLLGRRLVLDVLQVLAGGDDAQAGIVGGQTLQERFEGLILEPPGLRIVHRILQRLDAVEDEQRAMPADEPGQPFAALPRAALGGVGIVEELERLLNEQVGRGLPRFAGPLAVERPIEVAFDARPALGRHPLADPVRHERRLADAAPGDQRVDVQSRIRPGRIERVEPVRRGRRGLPANAW